MSAPNTKTLAPATITAAMAAVDKCGEQTIGTIMSFMLFVDTPGDNWWIGTKHGFVRPRVNAPAQFTALSEELIRPILEQSDTPAEQKIDQILCMVGAICVLCGFNPPARDAPTKLRRALQSLLLGE